MFRLCITLCLLLVVVAGPQLHSATSPQDQFLRIYLMIQEAEKMELAEQKASARERYQLSLTRLNELKQAHPQWESTIVNYRIKFCEDKVAALVGEVDAVPDQPIPPVTPEMTGGRALPAPPPVPERDAVDMVRTDPAGFPMIETTLTTGPGDAMSNDPAVLRQRIRQLEDQLADTRNRFDQARTEAAQLRTRVDELDVQLQAARTGTPDEQTAVLMRENEALRERLSTAETQLAQFSTEGGPSLVNMQEQLKKVQDQLELSRRENDALQQTNQEFRSQLESIQRELTQAREATAEATESLRRENDVLRDIVSRQLQEQTRREVAKRLALEELEAMNVDSVKLKTQLDILGSPLVELSAEERAMLRTPGGLMVDDASSTIAAPMSDGITSRPRVPAEFRDTAREANELFAQQRFDEAAAKYQLILNEYPDSLYALSNIAVVRFQQGRYDLAEDILRRAVQLSPRDAFSHSILGISLYQQGKYDDAVQMLSRAVALDPNDPKTRNYLGIAASQKGWQEAAEQECRKAIELDPDYGDAHFNLAVIYATQKPPARELSRRHYNRALELGVPRDNQLEGLIR